MLKHFGIISPTSASQASASDIFNLSDSDAGGSAKTTRSLPPTPAANLRDENDKLKLELEKLRIENAMLTKKLEDAYRVHYSTYSTPPNDVRIAAVNRITNLVAGDADDAELSPDELNLLCRWFGRDPSLLIYVLGRAERDCQNPYHLVAFLNEADADVAEGSIQLRARHTAEGVPVIEAAFGSDYPDSAPMRAAAIARLQKMVGAGAVVRGT